MVEAVIFDFDGLLADTECLHCRAYQLAFGEVGLPLEERQYADHWVRAGLGVREWIQGLGLDHDPVALRGRKAAHYQDLVAQECRSMPGALDLLQRLHGKRKLAVASSGYVVDVHAALRVLGIAGYFEHIACGDQVARIKPAPDLFLLAAEKLRADPSRCVVLEDAEKGILAADAAGMKSIAVPTAYTRDNDFSRASVVVRSLDEVTLEMLDELADGSR